MKTILFVNNHIGGLPEVNELCNKENLLFGGTLFSDSTPIIDGYSYAISPCEAGLDYVVSLFDKFNEVIFLKNHNNSAVLIMQTELEIIYKKSYRDICSKLDQNKIHFFGCSHTEGTGHESPSTTYPSVLSTLLNLEYVNHALGGKGNYDIEDLMNTFTIQNSKIVVQFTDMYRIRYFYDNILFQSALHRADPCVHNPIFLSEENLFFNFKKIVERIVNRLREGNNQFLITFSHNIESDYSIKSLEFLLEFKEFRSMQDCAIDVGTDNVHFGIITHKLWANRLYKRWVELYGQT